MNNIAGSGSAELSVFSGTVTLADPTSLPEGASPRNQNCDFNVGSVFTRSGLTNPFTYQNSNVSGPGNAVTDVSQGSAWSNPSSILTDAGFYAINTLLPTQFPVSSVQVLSTMSGFATIVTFAGAAPAVAIGQSYSFSGLTTYTSLNGQTLAPVALGLSLAANQQSFLFGSSVYADTSDTGNATVSGIVSPTDFLDMTELAFSVASTVTVQGFSPEVLGYAAGPATLHVQLLKAGVPVGNVEAMPLNIGSPATLPLGGINDLFGTSWTFADLNSIDFGIRLWATAAAPTTVYLSYTTLTAYFVPGQVNFNYVTTFEDDFGTIRTLALDANGQWWAENVSQNPGILVPLFDGPPANSFASSFTADSREYIAISDLSQGNYPPQQYTGQWNDRVSQVGPGAAPTFTGITAGTDTYAISSITQLPAMSWGFAYFLQSTGPGSTTAGNVVTVYYADSTETGPDTNLVNSFNSGQAPVYVYTSFTGGPVTQGPYVQQVTSVGLGSPPGQPRQFYYYTYNLTTSIYTYYQGSGHAGYTANYQQTQAALNTAVPVPGLEVGNTVNITGNSVSNWNSTWTITQTLNSGQFTITQTTVSGGLATYTYNLVTGSVPTSGQLVTVTNTLNDNGALNVVNAVIVSASGGSTGTFTVNVSAPDSAAAAESGLATTAGTQFTFDPGAALAGSTTDPIYGNGTGGTLTFGGPTGQFIGTGTRRGTLFFITRNGYWTAPAPYVQFTIVENTVSIRASNILIGPPNVIARAIVFTEGGTNGVPGASYYTIPTPVTYVVEGVTYTASSLFINDNTTTSASFSFPDQTLLNATEVDIQGADLFNLEELPDSAWCVQYAGRTVWGRVRNQVQNFENMSFDGGYLANPGGQLAPSFWSQVLSTGTGTLLVSPVFGNSYYMQNLTGSTQAQFDMIYQSAYQDQNLVAILQNQTAYSVRVTARTPSSATSGSLVVDLCPYDAGTGFGTSVGTFTLPLASMTSAMTTYEGTILTDSTLNIPSDLQIRAYGGDLPDGADIEIDRIMVFPTQAPTNLTGLTLSYGTDPASGASDPESFDQVTGIIDTKTVNSQPANGAFQLRGLLYVVKESSLGYLKDTPNQEPANWNPFEEVSNVAGGCGIHAYTIDKHKGAEWASMACQNGWYLFNGGAPTPIQVEIQDLWNAINWDDAEGTCLCNDIPNQKMYAAICLPTPNPWMIDATVNAAPTTPNVILALDYKGMGTIDELMAGMSIHMTMMGKLAVHDIRRKWSLWTIPTPFMGLVKRSELRSIVMFCNGIGSSKIYYLDPSQAGFDDGVAFTSAYCTYGFIDASKESELPMFGQHNKRYRFWDILTKVTGDPATLTFYQNSLDAPYPFVVPGGIGPCDITNDLQGPLDEYAQRLFVEIVSTNGSFSMSRLMLSGAQDTFAPVRGF